MAVIDVSIGSSLAKAGYRFIAASADTLPTTNVYAGDRAFITDGQDKFFNGSSWTTEAAEPLGSVTVSSLPTASFEVPLTITRPANTTAYSIGDTIGGALDLGVFGSASQILEIISSRFQYNVASLPAGMGPCTLHLYNVTPPSAIADNAAWDLPAGDRASYLGGVLLGQLADLGSTLYIESNDIHKLVKLSGTHLFAYLVTSAAFTPAGNSEVLVVTLSGKIV